jgi:four helix bundle protein
VSHQNLKDRTKAFALEVVGLVEELPHGRSPETIGNQLLRAGTSVGANYRAACHARSRREFIAKLGIVEEEADETQFWMDLIIARGWADTDRVTKLREEARQLVAIIVASIRTARRTPRSIPHSALRISN